MKGRGVCRAATYSPLSDWAGHRVAIYMPMVAGGGRGQGGDSAGVARGSECHSVYSRGFSPCNAAADATPRPKLYITPARSVPPRQACFAEVLRRSSLRGRQDASSTLCGAPRTASIIAGPTASTVVGRAVHRLRRTTPRRPCDSEITVSLTSAHDGKQRAIVNTPAGI